MLFAELAGLLLGAVQLLPTIDALGTSTRSATDATFTNSGSLDPLNAIQLVAPYLFVTRVVGQNTHELGLYVGAVPLLLCAWLLGNRQAWQEYRPLIVSALVIGVIGFILACGEHGFLYPIQSHLPLIGSFRFPCRAIVLVQFAAAVLAAIGLLLLLRQSKSQGGSFWRFSPEWMLLVLSLLVAALAPGAWPEFVNSPLLVWVGPLVLLLGVLAITAAKRGYRAGLISIVLFTALDLGAYGLSYAVWPHATRLDDFIAKQDVPPDAQGSIVAESDAVRAQGLHVGNRLLLAGYRRADGYSGLEPAGSSIIRSRRPSAWPACIGKRPTSPRALARGCRPTAKDPAGDPGNRVRRRLAAAGGARCGCRPG